MTKFQNIFVVVVFFSEIWKKIFDQKMQDMGDKKKCVFLVTEHYFKGSLNKE